MRIVVLALVGLLVGMHAAVAQPGQTPPTPYPAPAPGPYAPPPYTYAAPPYGQPAVLTPEEHDLLLQGEITPGAHLGGVAVNLFIGFGLGQAVQGRWNDTGWIFTLGEVGTLTLLVGAAIEGIDDCTNGYCEEDENVELMVASMLGYVVFRVWSVADAIGGPSSHNRRVRDLKLRLGMPVRIGDRIRPYVRRTRDDGATAGLSLSF